MINALSIFLAGGNPEGRIRAAHSLEQQGFAAATALNWSGGMLDTWTNPAQQNVTPCLVQTNDRMACCVGPLWYRNHFGIAALNTLLGEVVSNGSWDEAELRGNFALFIHAADCALLLNDPLGFVRLYVSADGRFYSTSWLAACAYVGTTEIDEAATIEYVLLGAAHSERTVARGVTILPLAQAFDLTHKCLRSRFPNGMVPAFHTFNSCDEAADAAEAHCRRVFASIAMAFPGKVNAALSGGFDSRLIVAGLLAAGTHPALFVYGRPESRDVSVARAVAESANIALNIVNKEVMNGKFPAFDRERLERSALFFDGMPNDGIYDPGADRQTRLEQNCGGAIAVNGGGGEIFRNFFHLPDRSFRPMDIVRTFYRGFDPAVFRVPGALGLFEERLADSILNAQILAGLGVHEVLDRRQVELVYPLFRCHYWMSVNNSVAVRHGYYTTPLVDLQSVRIACSVPLKWKNAGRLESCLIARFHKGMADQVSAYGFRFSDGPDWRAKFLEWSTCMRPVFTRPFINAARRRVRNLGIKAEMIRCCRNLLPGEWRLDPIMDLEHLPDIQAFARALAVEYAWRVFVA